MTGSDYYIEEYLLAAYSLGRQAYYVGETRPRTNMPDAELAAWQQGYGDAMEEDEG